MFWARPLAARKSGWASVIMKEQSNLVYSTASGRHKNSTGRAVKDSSDGVVRIRRVQGRGGKWCASSGTYGDLKQICKLLKPDGQRWRESAVIEIQATTEEHTDARERGLTVKFAGG